MESGEKQLKFEVSGRHSEGPRFYQRAEESPVSQQMGARDPSLRLESGYAQDDPLPKVLTEALQGELRGRSVSNLETSPP